MSSHGDRPTLREIIQAAALELPTPFAAPDIVNWAQSRHPDVREDSLRSQITLQTGNNLSHRLYGSGSPILWKIGPRLFEPYDPDRHGAVDTMLPDDEDALVDAALFQELPTEAKQEFLFEQYLHDFLEDNWVHIDFGRSLELWSPDERSPREFDTRSVGRIDFLCRDPESDALVVVELKRASSPDAVVGQTVRYMGWVKSALCPEQRVEGIIVVGEADPRLLYAVSVIPNLRVMVYRVQLQLHPAALS
jgi:Endonuclease NucS